MTTALTPSSREGRDLATRTLRGRLAVVVLAEVHAIEASSAGGLMVLRTSLRVSNSRGGANPAWSAQTNSLSARGLRAAHRDSGGPHEQRWRCSTRDPFLSMVHETPISASSVMSAMADRFRTHWRADSSVKRVSGRRSRRARRHRSRASSQRSRPAAAPVRGATRRAPAGDLSRLVLNQGSNNADT
jgi:hypothetical protein